MIYIIKENRTYDQVFGDLPRGNGDPSLVMFGREVTPNHHKLAEEFVLLDNLYCNGHVSADGHPWSTMAYNTDYIARDWALTYSGRAGVDDDDDGDLAKAPSGYLWDACAASGLSLPELRRVRQARQPARRLVQDGRRACPAWSATFSPDFGVARGRQDEASATPTTSTSSSRSTPEFEKDGDLPRFIVMSLGEDHTDGHHARRLHPGGLRGQQRPGARPAGRGRHARASRGPRRRSS